ncbi:bifunctional nicotinamidase/pyrazinamidase [Microvirga sp. STR05]|uniref:nicotinamidase n=1 Tax=Hymenobacter duratus TaxID=2771356 RepID=A0ABR8JIQ6_9BACT|nr:bifunctional nicotinamidase/pyrazinamidase [Hymenobacter duratus]MBD2715232.1 bifunctional nicotinamidase/pyrazinamidase [Hymenobacter duratus]MBR7950139.1 bifunctional nicotinamidase/pyrazinamidase [Microvirga sp. STR05]
MKALLLIDIQNDFVPGGALAVAGGDTIIPSVNRLQLHFGLVVATQDWHPAGHGSFASSHPGRKPFEQTELHGLPQTLWPDHCVQGTPGADFHAALDQHRIEAIFRKGTNPAIDSYSGFFDNGHRKSTGLADYLRGRGVTQVYLAGLAADYCVYFSAKDALQEGFEVCFVEDAARAISADGYQQARTDLLQRGAQFVTVAEVVR